MKPDLYITASCRASEAHSRSRHQALFLVLMLGMVLRAAIPMLAFSLSHDKTVFHGLDTPSYLAPALSMITRGDFSRDNKPETIRTPGYPILLIPGILVNSLEFVTLSLHVLLGGLTIYFVYAVTLFLSGEDKAAIMAALLFAVEPLSVVWTSILQSETMFVTFLMGSLLFCLRYMRDTKWKDLILSSVLLISATYVRPAAYFLPAVIFVFFLGKVIFAGPRTSKAVYQPVIFLMICYGVLGVWQFRNAQVAGYWGFSTVSENNLYFFAASTVMAQVTNTPYEEQRRLMIADRPVGTNSPDEGSVDAERQLRQYRNAKAIQIILSYPSQYLKVVGISTLWTLGGPGIGTWVEVFRAAPDTINKATEDDKFHYLRATRWSRWGSFFLAGILASYWLAALVGSFTAYYKQRMAFLLLLAVVAYFVIAPAMLCIGYSRFRHPIMPIVCVLAGYGLFVIAYRWKRRATLPL